MYFLFLVKRFIEDVVMLPLLLLGRVLAWLKPLGEDYEVFFFFPFYSMGGAEKVHAQITAAIQQQYKGVIFFTRKSRNDLFLEAFKKTGFRIVDISMYTDNKWLYPLNIIYRGIVSGYINRQDNAPVVFNGQCNFGYKIAPWIKRKVPQVELIHSFNNFSWIRVPFLPYYEKSVMISHETIKAHKEQYKRIGVPEKLASRIIFISNGIELPEFFRTPHQGTVVLYAGRGSTEKRVHLVAAIAKKLHDEDAPVSFHFMGDVKNSIPESLHPYCRFLGNQNDPQAISEIYAASDILILTSSFEGFPMVVMEAMAMGVAIISTAVGDLPFHVKDGENGFLIRNTKEEEIVESGATLVSKLSNDSLLLAEISNRNKKYAQMHFGIDAFNMAYLRLFETLRHHATSAI